MITEDYVSFETAKLLKEKGYCNISNTLYKENGEFIRYNVGLNNKGFSTILGNFYEAPTLQMAMKWLRDIHNINIGILFNYLRDFKTRWNFYIEGVKLGRESMFFHTPEEACEAAIKYCLENLI